MGLFCRGFNMLKSKEITLTDRDERRTFVITEMPVTKLQRFIIRFAVVAAGSGILQVDVKDTAPDDIMAMTAGALNGLDLGKLAMMNPDTVQPLLDELLGCVSYRVGNNDTIMTPDVVDTYIKDIRTLWALYREVVMLHFDFLFTDASRKSTSDEPQLAAPQTCLSTVTKKKNTTGRKMSLR